MDILISEDYPYTIILAVEDDIMDNFDDNNTAVSADYKNGSKRNKRPSGLLFLTTALVGAVIGGLITQQ